MRDHRRLKIAGHRFSAVCGFPQVSLDVQDLPRLRWRLLGEPVDVPSARRGHFVDTSHEADGHA